MCIRDSPLVVYFDNVAGKDSHVRHNFVPKRSREEWIGVSRERRSGLARWAAQDLTLTDAAYRVSSRSDLIGPSPGPEAIGELGPISATVNE